MLVLVCLMYKLVFGCKNCKLVWKIKIKERLKLGILLKLGFWGLIYLFSELVRDLFELK